MLLNKKNFKLVSKVIETWKNENVISPEESIKLKQSITLSKFDWKRATKYSFWIAAICVAISFFTFLFDDAIMAIIEQLLSLSDLTKSIILGLISFLFYIWSFQRRKTHPEKTFSNEFILLIGAIITAPACAFFMISLNSNSFNFSKFLFTTTIIYTSLGVFFRSPLVWILGILSMGSYYGFFTAYLSGSGAYFFGMNYPLRFIFFGAAIIGLSFILERTRFSCLKRSTYILGLLYLFIALWIMSIFGNYGSMNSWHHDPQTIEIFLWSLFFGIAAVGSILWGLKKDDGIARGFGITFLFLNLYTKFFELFWDEIHKALFFAVLGLSFWFFGKYSEKAYNRLKNKIGDSSDE